MRLLYNAPCGTHGSTCRAMGNQAALASADPSCSASRAMTSDHQAHTRFHSEACARAHDALQEPEECRTCRHALALRTQLSVPVPGRPHPEHPCACAWSLWRCHSQLLRALSPGCPVQNTGTVSMHLTGTELRQLCASVPACCQCVRRPHKSEPQGF